jgi:hypothetical protein
MSLSRRSCSVPTWIAHAVHRTRWLPWGVVRRVSSEARSGRRVVSVDEVVDCHDRTVTDLHDLKQPFGIRVGRIDGRVMEFDFWHPSGPKGGGCLQGRGRPTGRLPQQLSEKPSTGSGGTHCPPPRLRPSPRYRCSRPTCTFGCGRTEVAHEAMGALRHHQ